MEFAKSIIHFAFQSAKEMEKRTTANCRRRSKRKKSIADRIVTAATKTKAKKNCIRTVMYARVPSSSRSSRSAGSWWLCVDSLFLDVRGPMLLLLLLLLPRSNKCFCWWNGGSGGGAIIVYGTQAKWIVCRYIVTRIRSRTIWTWVTLKISPAETL